MTLVNGPDGRKPPFPVLNDTTPALGITEPMKNTDLIVQMTQLSVFLLFLVGSIGRLRLLICGIRLLLHMAGY